MPPKKKAAEKSLTQSQLNDSLTSKLEEFYNKLVGPRIEKFEKDFKEKQENIEWKLRTNEASFIVKMKEEFQENRIQLTTEAMRFYNMQIEPRLKSLEQKLEGLTDESLQRFDHLFKNLEVLRQEYIFSNEQMKRLGKSVEELERRLNTH